MASEVTIRTGGAAWGALRAQGNQRQSNKWDHKTKQKGIAMTRPCCRAGAGREGGRDFPTQIAEKSILRGGDRWELCLDTISWDSRLSQRLFNQVFNSDSSAPGQSSVREGRMPWLPKHAALGRAPRQLGSQPAPQHVLVAQQSDFPLTCCP